MLVIDIKIDVDIYIGFFVVYDIDCVSYNVKWKLQKWTNVKIVN